VDEVVTVGGVAVTPEAGRLAIEEAADRPYERSADHLLEHHRLSLCKHTLERLAQLVGGYWLDQDQRQAAQRRRPLPQVRAPERCVVFADGVMVHTDGDWHEARVGCVRSERQLQTAQGPRTQTHKSSIVRFADPATFGKHLYFRARELGYSQAKISAFVGDGAHWLWNLADRQFRHAIQVLDFYHLSEHIHRCGDVVLGEGSEAAARWAVKIKGTLRAGLVDEALQQVQALPTLTDEHRQARHELLRYLQNNRTRMDYPRYEKLGLPIGSGEVEAQCKALVQARCKQSGMRWTTAGAESLLRIRCAVRDGRFATAFGHWATPLTVWAHDRQTRAA
jgi:hypothetical protein